MQSKLPYHCLFPLKPNFAKIEEAKFARIDRKILLKGTKFWEMFPNTDPQSQNRAIRIQFYITIFYNDIDKNHRKVKTQNKVDIFNWDKAHRFTTKVNIYDMHISVAWFRLILAVSIFRGPLILPSFCHRENRENKLQ